MLGSVMDILHTSSPSVLPAALQGWVLFPHFIEDKLGLERIQPNPGSLFFQLVLKQKYFIL